ncbi:hypothetical protein [Edaphobacter bradus]|uniref:hypothetical protein n=1 Tax=Edaphobacter bradus TaxID=2259016 RepID=UPI0021E001E6|nr:hypothetical protein [Edaphobacter bradus]
MRIAETVFRYLLGLLFTVFGLNGFFHFIPQPPPANPVALQFLVAVSVSHYMALVFLLQIIGGTLLLAGRFVPLALAILAPIVVNILNYHITMDPGGIGRGLLVTTPWIIVFLRYRSSFAQILQQHLPEKASTTP